jgi:hypothetical protein
MINSTIYYIVLALLLGAVLGYTLGSDHGFERAAGELAQSPFCSRASKSPPQEWTACPADAKQCPDGTFVGRVGPHCEFAACPSAL